MFLKQPVWFVASDQIKTFFQPAVLRCIIVGSVVTTAALAPAAVAAWLLSKAKVTGRILIIKIYTNTSLLSV